MKTRFLLISLLALFAFSAWSQEKQLSMQDAVIGQWREYYPKYLRNLSWRGESYQITWIDGDSLKQVAAKGGKEQILLTLDDLNAALYGLSRDSLRYFPAVSWSSDAEIRFVHQKRNYSYQVNERLLEEGSVLPENAENLAKSEDGWMAFTREKNIFIQQEEGAEKAITTDGKYGLVYGESVHRNEFGIDKGLFWSPKASYLAFYRMDESMVSDYPLVDVSSRVATLKNIKYPMAGMESHQVSIGVYHRMTGETIYLEVEGPKDQYLTSVAWTPDEQFLMVGVLNREQNRFSLQLYEPGGKMVRELFTEEHPKYVEPEKAPVFLPGSSDRFIWESERDGYNQVYLYDLSGNVLKQLTKGNDPVTSVYGFDAKGKNLFIERSTNQGLERHAFQVNVNNLKEKQLTTGAGVHQLSFSADKKFFIDQFSNLTTPRTIRVYNLKSQMTHRLLEAENPLDDLALGEMSLHSVKAADVSTLLNMRVIKPFGFEEGKKYPLIVYVYGGPHAQMITNSWLGGARMWEHYMAQQGYLVAVLDNRGSAHRGRDFEQIIHRQLGQVEAEDQLKGIEYLDSLGWIDKDRIGVHGWSYGGFMTINLMTRYPKIFKVGVAGGPVIDWKFYEVMYGERYMDTPEENPEGYAQASLLTKAENLSGKLLIIHGGLDNVVVLQHSQEFLNACIRSGKQVDFFVYPQHEHNVRGMDRIHLMQKVTDYFEDYLN